MKHLTLSFFGAFKATVDTQPLTTFRSVKSQGLLIYLALTPHQAHSRDGLAALFWPQAPETTAKQNLRLSLYRLRQLLGDTDGEEFLLITRTTVQFNPASSHSLDVADFLAALEEGELETAVSLYHGDLLPGFTCGSLPFDDWLRQERERHHRLALDALFKLTAQSLAQAAYQIAQNLAQQQLKLEPWREEAHRQLIQAFALHGQRSAAIAQYETCRAILAEELGVEPAAETKTLLTHIRNQQPTRSAVSKAALPERRRLTIPFAGRRAEHATLVEAYQQAISNGVQVILLSGNSGIGKTRLTEHFLTWAAMQGADVLQSHAFETSSGLSYQPLTQLLRQRIERENAPEDLLSDLWLSQLTRLLPELRDRYPDLPEPTQEENTARQHLFEAVTRLLLALAQREPLLLFIDDWHWADSASLDLLHYAAVRWAEENAPILVVLTLRQEALIESPDLQSWLTKLNHTTAPVPLQLSELSQTETEQLVQTLLEPKTGSTDAPMTQFSDWLFAETGGQPLFLTETLKALVEDGLVQPDTTSSRSAGSGQASWHIDWAKFELQMQRSDRHISPGVQQIIKGWLAHLTTIAAKLLSAAAVLAKETTFERLCSVAGLEEFEALTALDELLGKQLLEERETSQSVSREPLYRFSHQKVGEVVYAEAGTARRRILHRRAFEMLKTGAVPAADLAHHALNAGLLSETIHYSLIAGNEAMALFAFRVAIVHFETVWQIAEQDGWPETISGADRQAFYVSMGRAYELDEGWPQAKKIYEAMIGVAQTMGATAMECLGLNHLATVYIFGLRDQQPAIPLLEQARTVAEKNNDGRGLAETEDNLSLLALMNGDVYGVLHHGEKALNLARQLGHPQLIARCLNRLARVQFPLRRWEIEEAYASESLQYYAITGNLVLAADSQRVLGISQIFSGRLREGLDTLQETFAFSEQIENLWGEADCGWMLALAFVEVGEYGQAIRHAQTAVEKSKKVGIPHMISISLTSWGIVQRTVMALDASREAQTAGLEIYNHRGMPTMPTIMDWISGELCALCALGGDWTQAHSYARQTLGLRVEASLPPFGFTGWYETEALLRGGDGDLARAEVERLAGIVGSNKRYQLPLLRSQAVLAQWDGDAEQAISHLQAALALAQEIGLPGEEWPILGALGGLYGEQGEDVKAREAYGEAAVIIHRLAETIDDEGLREGFLTAVPVQSILEVSEVF